ncbi:unnamed protein product [Lupinus luteus]|uniref:Uncharacterized protein n=1 Tax=Lupinus luteus TaxID=3873 RepID=A0AAV1YIS0_LUPLU
MFVLMVVEAWQEGMPTSTVVVIVAPTAGIILIRTKEGETHYHFCGHSVLPLQTIIIIILKLGEATLLQPLLTNMMEQAIVDGLLITKSCISSHG